MQRCVAIIPARGGSKGIPGKNLMDLCGKPLVAHTIEHARSAPSVQRVIVSTDDDEIARVAEMFGAEVIRRPSEISGDTARSEAAIVHVLEELSRKERYESDLVVFLQATSPLRRPEDVQASHRPTGARKRGFVVLRLPVPRLSYGSRKGKAGSPWILTTRSGRGVRNGPRKSWKTVRSLSSSLGFCKSTMIGWEERSPLTSCPRSTPLSWISLKTWN